MESPPVSLGLHVPGFDLPLFEEIRHPFCYIVVINHVAEVIKGQILHLSVIAVGKANHFWGAEVLVLAKVSCGKCLKTVSHHMTIEFHQHSD